MIVFDLCCSEGHRFEGWFGSSGDYSSQQERGLVTCPACGSSQVDKAPMAPAVPAKGNTRAEQSTQMVRGEMPAEVKQALKALAEAQAKALEKSTWVGADFAEKARSMHYGEADEAPIHGQASKEEAEEMLAEGIAVAPLLFPVAPPEELN
ncbi:DUF1178 family protein [Qipengyuania sp. RANM35]|uniref:DUF1178 family protein n=1 Tax=Qipengyuania sp. RANM35 TaxID=3068635 RepID=UPI0034DB666C